MKFAAGMQALRRWIVDSPEHASVHGALTEHVLCAWLCRKGSGGRRFSAKIRRDPSSVAHKFFSDEKSFVSTEGGRAAVCLSSCAEFPTLPQKLATKLQTVQAGPKTSASPGQSHGLANSVPKKVSASFQELSKVSDCCRSKFSFLP